jgi:ferredoxin-NADP reductase/Na+-translocating ferredoxin:NAD+ oxidoreductase RnfD subunit
MYRLVLYYLIVLLVAAVIFSFLGILSYDPLDLIFSTLFLVAVSYLVNKIFSFVFRVPANVESDLITALILAVIVSSMNFWFLFWVATLAQASKYILGYKGKHIFNPAAFAVALTAITISQSASWWVGTAWMLPLVIIGGFLIVRKIQRFDLVLSFLFVSVAVMLVTSPSRSVPLLLLQKIFLDSPIVFFATIMLTEPLTTPPTRKLRIAYGAFVGLMFAPWLHIGSVYSTPELALLVGNIFSYIISPKGKYLLKLKSKVMTGTDTYDLSFESNQKVKFSPGQYLEWTLGHKNPDNRGNRRYFTIASSPTEEEIRLGVKFYPNASSFKNAMFSLEPGSNILAGSLSGDFTLPEDKSAKLVWIAGGIGITPFRSQIKYLMDKQEKRDIVLLYSNKENTEPAYAHIFDEAEKQLGIKTVFTSKITSGLISQEITDFKQRTFYISGPHGMVVAFENTLKEMGVPNSQIKIDFFPGFV